MMDNMEGILGIGFRTGRFLDGGGNSDFLIVISKVQIRGYGVSVKLSKIEHRVAVVFRSLNNYYDVQGLTTAFPRQRSEDHV